MIYVNASGAVKIHAQVGIRGAAVLERLGYLSETAIEYNEKKAARRARLDTFLKERRHAKAIEEKKRIDALLE